MRKCECGHDKFKRAHYVDVSFDLDGNLVKDDGFNASRNQSGAFSCARCCAQYTSIEDIPRIKEDHDYAEPVVPDGSDIFTVVVEGDGPGEVDIFNFFVFGDDVDCEGVVHEVVSTHLRDQSLIGISPSNWSAALSSAPESAFSMRGLQPMFKHKELRLINKTLLEDIRAFRIRETDDDGNAGDGL